MGTVRTLENYRIWHYGDEECELRRSKNLKRWAKGLGMFSLASNQDRTWWCENWAAQHHWMKRDAGPHLAGERPLWPIWQQRDLLRSMLGMGHQVRYKEDVNQRSKRDNQGDSAIKTWQGNRIKFSLFWCWGWEIGKCSCLRFWLVDNVIIFWGKRV